MRVSYDLISPDNDVNEPPDTWSLRVPRQYHDCAPKIIPTPRGGHGSYVEGLPPKGSSGLSAVAIRQLRGHKVSGLKFGEMVQGKRGSLTSVAPRADEPSL